jgi:hypothetical protein
LRPQLFGAGALVMILAAVLYVLEIPLVFFWSIPFAIGGAVMAVLSFFLPESSGPVEPPEGYRFCPFCSSPVKLDAKRCDHCNGVQPGGGA